MLTHITKIVRFLATPIVIGNDDAKCAKSSIPSPKQMEEGRGLDNILKENPDDAENPENPETLKCLKQLVENTFPLRGIILGRRASGKSHIARDILLCHLQKSVDSSAIIFNGTERLHPVYGQHEEIRKKCVILNEYNKMALETFLERRKDFPEYLTMVVFDNCFDMGSSRCSRIEELMKSDVNTLVSCDHPLGIPLSIRTHSNLVFMFKEHVYVYRRRIFDNWHLQDIFSNMSIFENMYNMATEALYGYLIIDLPKKTCYIGRSLTPLTHEDV